ncbi:hypothetical protein ACFPM3_04285 [Streptomyces coeruleoprunus]|uniref:Secreted protein n=1 Tax=Streptomyces coeruleoprunus TaxID=285563 RepID=A0ABV9X955_9ACTN
MTGLRAGTRTVAAAALAVAAVLTPGLTATPAHAADSAPCTPYPGYPGQYKCPMWGSKVNMRAAPTMDSPVAGWSPDDGFIRAICQVKGGRATYGPYWHTWWIKTPAVGMAPSVYMSEIFLVGGGNDERDSGLPVC